jgi:pyruvate, orthophosphate dikinase
LGTAVNVQAMCFGNMGETSGTGVCFSRNPNTGMKELYGEYLINAQGEDVVAGIRTPQPISTLKYILPDIYEELLSNVRILEDHYRDMQDIEFTIEEGKLFILQTRNGKRVGPAAVKIAVDLVKECVATADEAILTVKPEHLNQLLHPQFSNVKKDAYTEAVVGRGLPASPGAAVGVVVFSPQEAEARHAAGEKCILVREDTSPEDVGGMWASEGVLTARGGMTSHAAVVARGWGKPCVCGCNELKVDSDAGVMTLYSSVESSAPLTMQEGDIVNPTGNVHLHPPYSPPVVVKKGDWISING